MKRLLPLAAVLLLLTAGLGTGCSIFGSKTESSHKAANDKEAVEVEPIKLTAANFDQEVLKSDKPVLVDFWASWCGPCRMVAPVVEEIARENAATLKVGKVNVDEESSLSSQYGIRSIPTLIIFKDGNKVDQIIGYADKNTLMAKIKPYL